MLHSLFHTITLLPTKIVESWRWAILNYKKYPGLIKNDWLEKALSLFVYGSLTAAVYFLIPKSPISALFVAALSLVLVHLGLMQTKFSLNHPNTPFITSIALMMLVVLFASPYIKGVWHLIGFMAVFFIAFDLHWLGRVAYLNICSSYFPEEKEFDLVEWLAKKFFWLIGGYALGTGLCAYLFNLMIEGLGWNPWWNCLTIPVSMVIVFVIEWTGIVLFLIGATGFTMAVIFNQLFQRRSEKPAADLPHRQSH